MKDFKKRTLILMLASVVTVTGSFAAENYKNCLMNLEFKPVSDHEISVILGTKTQFNGDLAIRKSDTSTYVIMLPEFDSSASTPNLSNVSNSIQSVEIKKMPYSNGNRGYTKILIRTNGNINLNPDTTIYLPPPGGREIEYNEPRNDDILREQEREQKEAARRAEEEQARRNAELRQRKEEQRIREERRRHQEEEERQRLAQMQADENKITSPAESPDTETQEPQSVDNNLTTATSQESSHQKLLFGLLVVLIILTSIYFYTKAQNKLVNVVGEKLDIDIDNKPDEKDSKQKRKRKISRTVNKLDSTYSTPETMPIKPYTTSIPSNNEYTKSDEDSIQVVDLDELFKEQSSKKAETNSDEQDALDDFLSGFSFEDEDLKAKIKEAQEEESGPGYDEEAYAKVLKNNGIEFTKDDINCFKELLQSEISDNVIQNIEQYAASNPITPQKPNFDKVFETLVTDYAVLQNVYFTADDIAILKKLMSVEIDADFVRDLKTNSKQTDEMAKRIKESQPKKPKPTEILTLNVRDMLPNLSEELKKHGKKPIVSDAKPETVYFSEGYEVRKLSVDLDLSELSKNKDNKSKDMLPTDAIQVVDQSYADSVSKLSITGLPDLNDVLTNPKKYKEPKPKEYIPDEKSLLASISNVQFKPFDDGTRNFEIINDFEEEETPENIPVVDIQKEFSQFSNFEVANEEEQETYVQSDYDDFESLYSQEYVDLDAKMSENKNSSSNDIPPKQEPTKHAEQETKRFKIKNKLHLVKPERKKREESSESFVPQNLERNSQIKPQKERQNKSGELIKKLENKIVQNIKMHLNESSVDNSKNITNVETKQNKNTPLVKCIIEGINYDIVASANITSGIECHLAKYNNGYAVLSNSGNNISILKTYDTLRSEKINARLSETLADGTPRYLIKIGLNKFIVDVIEGQLRYVMDL